MSRMCVGSCLGVVQSVGSLSDLLSQSIGVPLMAAEKWKSVFSFVRKCVL